MGLAKRIIPVLLMRHGHLVKGKQFDSSRVVGNARQAAEIHQARGVDELIILDVGATPSGKGPDFYAMAEITECCFMPIAVGGGVSEVWHVRELLANGADKVVIGTAARDKFIRQCVDKFGSQAIVVVINYHTLFKNQYWGTLMETLGAGEIMLNSIERDGMMNGYDLRAVKNISDVLEIPVIACGGCGKYLHMHQALRAGADAVAAGSLFQWTDSTPRGAAEYLAKKGWEVRL